MTVDQIYANYNSMIFGQLCSCYVEHSYFFCYGSNVSYASRAKVFNRSVSVLTTTSAESKSATIVIKIDCVSYSRRKLSRNVKTYRIMGVACLEFRGENFHGWLKNREIRENFLPRKFPAIRYEN